MSRTTLAVDVAAGTDRVFEILSSTEGQRGFWTANCDVSGDRARFGFAQAPVDLDVAVNAEPGKLAPKPARLSFEESAACPISAVTALQAVRDKARVRSGGESADRRRVGRCRHLRRADRQGVRC